MIQILCLNCGREFDYEGAEKYNKVTRKYEPIEQETCNDCLEDAEEMNETGEEIIDE